MIGPTSAQVEGRKKKFGKYKNKIKIKTKYKKMMLPLLMAYKLKFMALIPMMIGGLVLLAKAAGLAGFFFAMFTAAVGLKVKGHNVSH